MNWKETYTKIFLKSANIAIGENTLKEYMPMWWKNSRSKGTGGLRLTDDGITFIKEKLELQTYDVPFPNDFNLTTQVIIFLDKYLDNKPITNTLPQVKNTVLCKPINKSVTAKLARTIGKDLKPKKANIFKKSLFFFIINSINNYILY